VARNIITGLTGSGPWVQVGRNALPLFDAGLVGTQRQTLYLHTSPLHDVTNFGADILFPVPVRDAEALGIYNALGEPLIAVSIAYVAVENLIVADLTRWRVTLVFAFGLLHGLGFAGALGGAGAPAIGVRDCVDRIQRRGRGGSADGHRRRVCRRRMAMGRTRVVPAPRGDAGVGRNRGHCGLLDNPAHRVVSQRSTPWLLELDEAGRDCCIAREASPALTSTDRREARVTGNRCGSGAYGLVADQSRRRRQVVRQRSAKPPPPVQIRAAPPISLRNQRLTDRREVDRRVTVPKLCPSRSKVADFEAVGRSGCIAFSFVAASTRSHSVTML
jgi:hypothetical protein